MPQRCFGEQKGMLLCWRIPGAMFGAALGLTLAAGQAVQTLGGELPKPQPVAGHVMLPQEHQYQRQLRRYLATLTEQDFAHGVTAAMTTPPGDADREYQYRQFLYTLMNQPLVGSKRGSPSVNAPARLFLLSSIEGPNAVLVPPVWPETLISFVHWNYPGNPYYNNRGLKMRAFVTASVNLMMTDNFLEQNPAAGRADWFSYQLAFVVAKQAAYTAILHTGTVGSQDPQDGLFQFAGPLGFGGGQLSAFWTPQAGSVILGRRSGMTWDKSFETLAEWRTWPIHAVSGCRLDGKVFTSARILRPEVACDIQDHGATVKVRGPLVALKTVKEPAAPDREKARDQMYDEPLAGPLDYARTFEIGAASVRITTSVKGVRRDMVAELYETLPVFIREAALQGPNVTAAIEFLAGGRWSPATAEYRDQVTAVKITRFHGAVQIAFDRPQRVKLSPAEWKDSFLSSGVCRNILIDLREGGTAPERAIGYTITAAAK